MPDKHLTTRSHGESHADGITRRNLIVLSGQLALALSAGGLLGSSVVGCAGSATIEPVSMTGLVALDEVGGSLLSMRSVLGTASVGSDGSVPIQTSPGEARLILILDGSEEARAMCVVSPPSGGVSTCNINAKSTALAFLFLTPGIATSDPQQLSQRESQLQALATFAPLVAILRTQMRTKTLAQIIADPAFAAALEACISDYIDLPPVEIPTAPRPPSPAPFFEASIVSQTNPRAVQARLSNAAWRYVTLGRRDLTSGGATIDMKSMGEMAGGLPISFGLMMASLSGPPTLKDDVIDFGAMAKCEYWAEGPGSTPIEVLQPPHGNEGMKAATFKSIVLYLLFPLLNVVTQVSASPAKVDEVADDLWNAAKANVDLTALVEAMYGGSWMDAIGALLDAFNATSTYLLNSGTLVQKGLLTSDGSTYARFVLGTSGVNVVPANMIVGLYRWWFIGNRIHVDIEATGDGTVIIR